MLCPVTVAMEDSPARVTVNPLAKITASRVMGDTTKTQRAAPLIIRVDTVPAMDSPSQVILINTYNYTPDVVNKAMICYHI